MRIYPFLHYVAYSVQTVVNIVTHFPSFCVSRWCGGELFALSLNSCDGASENLCNLDKTLSKCVSFQERNGENKAPTLDALTLIYDVNL